MKYIDEFDIDLVNQALTFDTTDIHLQGTCDLFTTKPIGSDRKLYKTLDKLYSPSINSETPLKGRSNSDASIDSLNSNSNDRPYISPEFIKLKKRSLSYSYGNHNQFYQQQQQQQQQQFYSKSDRRTIRSKSFHTAYMSPKSLPKNYGNSFIDTNIESFDLNDPDSSYHDVLESSPFGPLSQQSSRRIFAYLIAILNSTYPDHDFSTVQPTNFTSIPSTSNLVQKVNSLLISLGKSSGLDWLWQTINTHMDLDDCICFQYEPEQAFLNDLPGTLWCNMYFMFNKKKKRVAFLYFRATRLHDTEALISGGARHRRNSKIGTLDEENAGFDETQEEYDLRYNLHDNNNAEVIYEDVFSDDNDAEDDIDDDAINDDVMDEDDDYEIDNDDLVNVNQDDEDEYGSTPNTAAVGNMEID